MKPSAAFKIRFKKSCKNAKDDNVAGVRRWGQKYIVSINM